MIDLDAIKARCEAATPGPWEMIGGGEYITGVGILVGGSGCAGEIADRDAEFVAAAREDVPALIEEVERLREALSDLTDTEPCQWDHNRSCQTHGVSFIPQGELCPMETARRLLGWADE